MKKGEMFMTIAVIIIVILAILALLGTIFAAKDTDVNYNKKTKRNVTRLTSIYAVVIVFAMIAVGVYIVLR
jgi:cytochrome c biogenesis protein ResB